MNKQTGLSLIELMVAVLISSILILGVTSLFSDTSNTAQTNTALARVQESGRLALELIGADARRAGYVGCINTASTQPSPLEMNVDTGGGILTFPLAAFDFSSTQLTFRYGIEKDASSTAPELPPTGTTCPGGRLELREVVYTNCPQGGIERICLNGQPMLDNAKIDSISLAIPTGSGTEWKEASASFSSDELKAISMVRVAITITEQENQASSSVTISRSFNGTYHLRNRS
jgi:type IV pilus assembly protein PilW